MAFHDNIAETVPLPSNTLDALRQARPSSKPAALLVYHREGIELIELGPSASRVIGRAPPADVQINDESLSREHARFTRQEDESVRVEDLESLNGTWVRGERVAHGIARIGDEVMLGHVVVAIVERPAGDSAVPGMMSHERFRSALDEEVSRARFFGRSAAILVVRPARGARAHVARWWPRVQALLRPVDKAALYSLDAVSILLPEATLEAALEVARAITNSSDDEVPLLAGVAASPNSATSAETLLAACLSAVRVAAPGRPVQAAPGGPWTWGGSSGHPPAGEQPVVASAAMQSVFASVARIARSSIPVLLQGETGTGKEVVARAIHVRSPRGSRRMVCVNCGAIPQQLVESTLFGHERGAFTGASQLQKGIFEAAEGGTVFLDEIGELPAAAQAALLRVLECKRITRVGASKEIDVDVRLIAATHRDLEMMCNAGTFRLDLLYRLNTMTLTIPPLRERPEEIGPLAMHLLQQSNEANERRIRGIEPTALALLESYSWPGNVRELRNVIERAVVIAEGEWITTKDLSERVRTAARTIAAPERAAMAEAGPLDAESAALGNLRTRLQHYETELIIGALRDAQWNQTEAARKLELPLRTLVHRMKLLGIKKLGYTAAGPIAGLPPSAGAANDDENEDD